MPILQRFVFLLTLSSSAQGADIVAVLNIDAAGPQKVAAAKSMPGVDWWIELGSRLIVRGDESNLPRWNVVPVLSTHEALEPGDLILWTALHCSGEHDHELVQKTLADPFLQVPGATLTLRGAKALLPEQQPLHANQVVLAQAANRNIPKSSESFTELTDQVSVERYAQTQAALAGFDRQENDELFAAIAWLEGELAGLPVELRREPWGLLTSRAPNLIAIQRGSVTPDEVFVIGAHLDSRNAGFDAASPSPGAEDNGSGSAGVLEVARAFAGATPRSTIVYAWFTGEERGLFGSSGYVSQQLAANTRIRGMLNMDMISYTSVADQRAAIISTTFATDLLDRLAASGAMHSGLDLVLRYNACCSDHMPFLDAGIPAVSTIQADVTSYPHYHRFTDTVDHLTPDLGVQITRMNAGLLASLAGIEPDGQAAFAVDGGISGYWYDPAQSGQGFQIEVLASGDAVVTWYTFDENGNQLWLIGSGTVAGNEIQVDFVQPGGGFFPPNFDPAAIHLAAWGTAVFRFASCSEGDVEWQPVAGGAGGMPLVRLTQPGGLTCGPN